MKLTPEKQKHLAIAVLGVVAVTGSLWYFGVQGLQNKQKTDTAEVERLQAEIKKQTTAKEDELRNRDTAKTYLGYIKSLEDQMPTGSTETWLEKNLRAVASRYKINLANTTVQPIKELTEVKFKGQPYRLEGFRFEFKAELNQIGQFLQDLENNTPLMEVDELTITGGSNEAPHIHSVSMRISMAVKS